MKYSGSSIPFLFLLNICSAQWTTLDVPFSTRYDDVFFINDTLGWTANGRGQIFHTEDGGDSWVEQIDTDRYLRSITFANPLLGFCGSLSSQFYRTTDGGLSWEDIAHLIDPVPEGICGLSAPTPDIIYGCGVWSSPAYVIKSTDGGNTWTSTDMSAHASALVDIHFMSADTGFVTGKATMERGQAGTILYTTDGGQSWTEVFHTERIIEYIWKIQTPDNLHFWASIDNGVGGNTLVVKSADKGLTWSTVLVDETYHYIQAIGFLDSLHGWTGGRNMLFETIDGGVHWEEVAVGSDYNRFFKINDSTAVLTGATLYKFNGYLTSVPPDPVSSDEIHLLEVHPNPAYDHLSVRIDIRSKTHCILRLFSSDGQLLRTIYDQPNISGEKSFKVSLRDIAPQILYLSMHTNEGVITREVVKGPGD